MEIRKREIEHYRAADGRDLFKEWIVALKDTQGQAAVLHRIDRVEDGNFGDHSYVGQGVWELRIHFGPGYRIYYGEDGRTLVILICGGDKHSQKKDIRYAQALWKNYKEERKQ